MNACADTLFDENALFAAMATGDEVAFTKIFHHYSQRIYPFILKKTKSAIIAEELVQDIFLKIWTKREELYHVVHYQSYIFTIAANKVYAYFRKIAAEEKLIKELWNQVEVLHNTTDEILELKESQDLINKAIEQLPLQRKKIYLLSRQEGLSQLEIAKKLNISTSTVNNQLTEALKFIKQQLKQSPELSLTLLLILMKYSG